MSSQSSPQTIATRYATFTGLTTPVTRQRLSPSAAAKIFDDPAGGHYRDMQYGPRAWDARYDDEERPRE